MLRTRRYRSAVGTDGEDLRYDREADPDEYDDVSEDPAHETALGECRRWLLQFASVGIERRRDETAPYQGPRNRGPRRFRHSVSF